MNGDQLRGFRDRRGMTQHQVAELLNGALDRHYTKDEVSRWERGKRPTPKLVGDFLDNVEINELADQPMFTDDETGRQAAGEYEEPLGSDFSSGRGDGDSAPPPPPGSAGPLSSLPTGDPALARVCEELWEVIATGVGLVGAATHSEALRQDGVIIDADKKALGRAWGKLAESNPTFRRMLLGATTSGAWLEVAMVSGITFGKCARNHQAVSLAKQQAAAAPPADDGRGEFDGSEIPGFPAAA